MAQDILPPLSKTHAEPAEPDLNMKDSSLPPELEFDPVPCSVKRSDALTAERQRVFIRLLAECGSVTTACKAVGSSKGHIYHLRNKAGGESFSAAWDKAVTRGARQVLDILVDQAINGTPEKIYKDGALVAERRHYNTRAMMWIVAHYLPERFGVSGGLMHSASGPVGMKRLKAAWHAEWQAELQAGQPDPEAMHEQTDEMLRAVRTGFKQHIATDPAKRAAWELLTGPTDWSDFDKVPDYGGNVPDTNFNRPDMIVPLAG